MAGNGAFVDINEGMIVLDDMHDQIDSTIAYTRAYANEMRTTLTVALEDLAAQVGTYDPSISDIDTTVDSLDLPVFPAAPNLPVFDDTCIFDQLLTKVCEGIRDGGTGLSPVAYNAIISREQEARRNNQEEVYRTGLDAIGTDGFDLPSGQVASFERDIAREKLSKDQDSLNNTLVKDFDVANNNTQFMIDAGIRIEKMVRDSWDSAAGRVVDIYKAETDGIASQYQSLVSWMKSEVDRLKIEADIAIEDGRLGLAAYDSAVKLATSVSEAIANIAAQSIASALGAINTTLSNQYSGSESRRENWGHNDSLRESHNYQEL